MEENTRTPTRPSQRTRRTPTAAEDRKTIAEHYRGEAHLQQLEDARAQWLGYQSAADFYTRAVIQLDRHRKLPAHMTRHARFIWFGSEQSEKKPTPPQPETLSSYAQGVYEFLFGGPGIDSST